MVKLSRTKFDAFVSRMGMFGIAMFFLLLFLLKSGHSIGVIVLSVTSVIAIGVLLYRKTKFNLTRDNKNLIYFFVVYGLGLLLINLWHQNPIKDFEYAGKFLLVIPIFLFFQKYPIKITWFFTLIMISTILGGCLGYYNHIHYEWASRATVKGLNTIIYSGVIQLFAFISLLGLLLAKKINNTTLRYLYITLAVLSFFVGIIASIFSRSRGVFLALPIQLLLVTYFYFKYYKKITLIVGAGIIFIFLIVYFIPQTNIKERIDKAGESLSLYQKGDVHTNVGLRLEMYKFSLSLAKEKPILGYSSQEIKTRQQQNTQISHLHHFHSHSFQYLAYYGVVGVFLLLGLYYFSFFSFLEKFKSINIYSKTLGMAGLLMLSSYFVYDLTDVLFLEDIGLFVYVVLTSVICSPLETQLQER